MSFPLETMDNKPYDKLRASGVNAPTAKMKFRTNVVIQIAMMLFACAIIINLFKVSVVQNKKYEALANNYHFGTMRLEAQRGAIYDATGTPLAWSATVYNVYIDPQLFRDEMDDVQKNNESKQAAAEKNGKTATDIVDVATLRENIATYLAGKLNLQKADIEKAFDADGRYYILQTQVEKNVADEIENYFDNLNLVSFATEATTRRYYPQEELAASVIGFTNGDGDGQYGLEYQFGWCRWQNCFCTGCKRRRNAIPIFDDIRSTKRLFSVFDLGHHHAVLSRKGNWRDGGEV